MKMKIKKTHWFLIVFVLIIVVGGVQIVLANDIYLPLVVTNLTLTPSLTLSATETLTPTPTKTPTPTSTPKPSGIEIDEIVQSDQVNFPLDEYVSIHNYSSSLVTLTDWFIRDDGENRYDFPDGFSIAKNVTVRIWSKDGTDTDTDLYWGSPVEVWNDAQDCAYLRDDSEGENELVDVYCYSESGGSTIVIIRDPE